MTGYENGLALLPPRLAASVEKSALGACIWEIRLRRNGPFSLTVGGENVCIDQEGRRCPPRCALTCKKEDLEWVLQKATDSSLYRYMPSLKKGYVTTPAGVRVGICSRGFSDTDNEARPMEISSLNLRIPYMKKGSADGALRYYRDHPLESTLFFSPPGGGKTTLMRDLARRLSLGETGRLYRVAVADEREELFPSHQDRGGGLLDVLSGYGKEEAMERAVRVLNPQVLVCDEVGNRECRGIRTMASSGVVFMATAHASSTEELTRRGELGELIREGYFPLLARLTLSGKGLSLDFVRCEDLL